MANLSLVDFKNHLIPFLAQHNIDINTHPKIDLLIESLRSSGTTFSNVAQNLRCYFLDVESYDEKAINKFIGDSDEVLVDLKSRISDIEEWEEANLDNLLGAYREEKNLKVPQVNQPLRIALTGSTNSPSLGLTMFLFDKSEVIKRISDLIVRVHKES